LLFLLFFAAKHQPFGPHRFARGLSSALSGSYMRPEHYGNFSVVHTTTGLLPTVSPEREAVFRQVTVDEFGVVCWPNGPDLALDAMHSEIVAEPTPQSRPQQEKTDRPAGAKPRAGR
jgi:hypothetical protein